MRAARDATALVEILGHGGAGCSKSGAARWGMRNACNASGSTQPGRWRPESAAAGTAAPRLLQPAVTLLRPTKHACAAVPAGQPSFVLGMQGSCRDGHATRCRTRSQRQLMSAAGVAARRRCVSGPQHCGLERLALVQPELLRTSSSAPQRSSWFKHM